MRGGVDTASSYDTLSSYPTPAQKILLLCPNAKSLISLCAPLTNDMLEDRGWVNKKILSTRGWYRSMPDILYTTSFFRKNACSNCYKCGEWIN